MSRRELLLETCEERILCSATAPLESEPQKPAAEASVAPADPSADTVEPASPATTADAPSGTHAAATTAPDTAATGTEIVFVDAGVADYEQFLADIQAQAGNGRQFEVYLLDATRDGVGQISDVLAGRTGIEAIHFVTHGVDRAVKLGNTWVDATEFEARRAEIAGWGGALSAEADILFYGCDLAASEAGRSLLAAFSMVAGADIAASADATGSAALGGNWTLEYQIGHATTAVAFTSTFQADWSGLLATFTVTTTADSGAGSLRQAIIDANALAGTDTISFNIAGAGVKTIALTSALPTITGTVVIDGYTQTGSSANTLATGSNATLLIELNGAGAGAASGLNLGAGSAGSTIRGLVINRFGNSGIELSSTGNFITGNFIGTNAAGTADLGNAVDGIVVSANNNTIGGSTAGLRNLLSGNDDEGIDIDPAITGTIIRGNYIGTNAAGTAAIGNGQAAAGTWGGILIDGDSTIVGGTNAGDANLISGNFQSGIIINGASNTILGNRIGTNAAGTAGLANTAEGIKIGGSNNLIGGTAAGAGNTIAYNSGAGVNVQGGTGNAILRNLIFSNTLLGIDLGPTGVTTNDGGDPDSGANNLQNFPVLTRAQSAAGQVTVLGSLNSAASSYYRVEFFASSAADGSGHGEGQRYLGFANIITDASGNATINSTFTASVAPGEFVSGTATKSNAAFNAFTDTSEFGSNVVVNAVNFQNGTDGYAGTEDTEIKAGSPGSAFGNATSISVDLNDGSGVTQGLIRFDNLFGNGPGQIPYGSIITSASLVVNVTSTAGSSSQITLHRMLSNWSEVSTWNSLTGGIQTNNVEANTAADSTLANAGATGTQTFTGLEAALQAWLDGAANYGWAIMTDSTDGWDFSSSENATVALRPALSVVYTANTAPVLDASKSPALAAINEDAAAPSGAVGTLVSQLVNLTTPTGGLDNVSDPDAGAVTGIAVTAAVTANGTWWFSTNGGTNWTALGAVANNNARLLAADATTRIYFRPNANYNGTQAAAITFRAWDQSTVTISGNGSLADASTNGGTTAFSSATDTASLTVNSVNDAPRGTNRTVTIAEDTTYTFVTTDFGFSDTSDSPANTLSAVRVTTLPAAGTLTNNGVDVTAGQFIAMADIVSGLFQFTPGLNGAGAPYTSFTFQVQDNGGTANGGANLDPTPRTMAFNVTASDDTPEVAPVSIPLAEGSANGTSVYDVNEKFTGTDLDPDGQPITYSITAGNTSGAFTINAATGVITVANSAALVFATNPVFNLTVRASDGTTNSTATVTVNLIKTPAGGGIGSFAATQQNRLYVISYDTGKATLLTTSPYVSPGNGINSMGFDGTKGIFYYSSSQSSTTNKAIYGYDARTGVHFILTNDVTTFGVTLGSAGLGQAGGDFSQGSYYFTTESGGPSGKDQVFKVDFVAASNGRTAQSITLVGYDNYNGATDYGDILIDAATNRLFMFNAAAGAVDEYRINLPTGLLTFTQRDALAGTAQAAKDRLNNFYNISSTIQRYNPTGAGSFGTPLTITTDGTSAWGSASDAGTFVPAEATIGDRVWYDTNANGIQDAGEVGVAGLTVTLYYDLNGNGTINPKDTVVTTTTTGADGFYSFTGLLPDTYIVEITDPTNIMKGAASTSGGATQAVSIALIGESISNIDFGFENPPTLSVSSPTVSEAGGYAVFTLSLSNSVTSAVTVNLALANGTAMGGGVDFGTAGVGNLQVSTDSGVTWADSTSATFAAGTTSLLVRTPIVNDLLDEANETFTLTATKTSGVTANNSAVSTATITDNDPLPSLSINNVTVNEAAGTATFTVNLNTASGRTVSVNYATSNGTATAGADYTTTSGALSFAAGVTSRTITVSILNDPTFEASETFNVTLSGAVNSTISTATGVGTIKDDGTGAGGVDNDMPTVSVSSPNVTEGTDGFAVFTVSLSNVSTTPVTVSLALAGGTALGGGTDFGTAGAGNLQVSTDGGGTWTDANSATIAAGSLSVLVRTPVSDDTLNESAENFALTATKTAGTTTNASATGTGTITDNDPLPSLSIDDVTVNEAAGTATFTVNLNTASGRAVTVNYATSNGTASAGADYTAASGTLNFAAGVVSQTITVSILNDTIFEVSEAFNVTLSGASNASIGTATGISTIRDDGTGLGGTDNDTPTIAVSSPNVTEGTDGFAVFSVSLSNASTTPVSVSLALANVTAGGGGVDYGSAGAANLQVSTDGGATWNNATTATIAAGGLSVLVRTPLSDDAVNESAETFTLTATKTAGTTTNASTVGTATIADNDPQPALSINSVTVNEAAGTVTFTVTMNVASAQPVSVNYATSNGTATAGTDYTAGTGTVDFAPGVVSQTITLPILNDAVFEGSETFNVTLSSAINATISTNVGIATIKDDGTGASGTDNDTPSLSVSNVTVAEGTDTHAVFAVALSNPSTTAVLVNLALANGTATGGGVDFGPALEVSTDGGATWNAAASATIAAGTTSVLVRTPVIDDTLNEAAETFTLTATRTGGTTANASALGTATITDNDGLPSLSIGNVTVNEAAGTASFTVTLNAASGRAVSVNYATSNGSAIAGADYTATSGTLNFAAGVTSRTITVPILNDAMFEGTETFNVTLSGAANATISGASGIGTIKDDGTGAGGTDNDTPNLSVSNVTATEGTETHAVFAVSLSNLSSTAVSVSLALANGTATGADYGPALEVSTDGGATWNAAATATIAAGSASVLVRTPIIDDGLSEASETFTLTATRTAGMTTNASATGTASINDNDALPTLSINNVTVNEAAGTATFTVTLSAASGQPVSVNYATSNGTATAGADFSSASGTLNFAAGVTTRTVTVAILNDSTYEGSETFNVLLSGAVNATISAATGVGAIFDDGTGAGGTDNDLPILAVSSPNVTEGTDAFAVFTLSLSNASTVATTVNLALIDGAALGGGVDFGSSGAGNLQVSTDGGTTWNDATSATFAAGSTSVLARTPVTNDALSEANETFALTATTSAGSTRNASATGTATIVDNDALPFLSIDDVSVNEGAGTATFTVHLTAVSGQAISVDYATSNDSATAGLDYIGTSGTLNFAPGVTAQTITIAISNDAVFEGTETFNVLLSNAVKANIADDTGIGTIADDGTGLGGTDNDTPTIAVSTPTVTEGTDAFAIFNVSLSNASTTPVSVNLTLTNITATGGGVDYGAGLEVSTDGGATWNAAASATFAAGNTSVLVRTPIVDDALDEASESFRLRATRTSGTTTNTNPSGIATIVDNDATPSLTINDIVVNEGTGTATFTVTLDAPSGRAVSVAYTTVSGTATAGADFTATSGTVNFAAGATTRTITVPILNDSTFEGSEFFTVVLSSAGNATIADNTGVATVLDDGTGSGGTDNDTPTLAVSSANVTEGTDGFAVFTVSLSRPSTTAVAFSLALADGTATGAGADYGSVATDDLQVSTDGGATWNDATSAVIAAGSTSVLVRTPIVDDVANEAPEDFTLTATVTGGTTTNGSAAGAGAIGDDDGLPSLSIGNVTRNEAAGTMTFTVTLNVASGLPVSVAYATSNGTATAGADYVATSGTLNFAPGETSRTITVSLLDDAIFESSEFFNVTLSAPTDAIIADDTATGAILDDGTGGGGADNDTPTLSVSNVSVTEGTGTHAIFIVSLSRVSTTPVSVGLALANGSASGDGTDFGVTGIGDLEVSTDGGATWANATTVTIAAGSLNVLARTPINNDALDENAEDFTLTATVSAGTTTNAAATGTATITDDDAPPSVSIDNVAVNEAAGTATFTVSLSAPSGLAVSVNYATSDGTATAGADYAGTSGVLNFAAGVTSQTITVSILNDALYEQSESFDVVLSGAVNATIASGTGVGTIRDDGTGAGGTDNDTPSLSVSSVSVTEGTDTHAVFAVNLSNASTLPVSVSLALLDGSAKGGGVDFGAGLEVSTDGGATWRNSTTATIAAGSMGLLVRTPVTNDALDEFAETFRLTATNGTAVVGSADQIYALQRLNDYRALVGAAPLTMDAHLNAFAAQGSLELSQNNVPHGHFNDAATAGTLFTTDGFSGDAAENQGDPSGWPPKVGGVQQQIDEILAAMWAEGPGGAHYDNMIDGVFGRVGIGLTVDGTGRLFFTNDFTGASGATKNSSASGLATVSDNDPTPSLTIDDVTVNEAAGTATFTVTLSAPSGLDASVNFATNNGTATAGADYTATSGTLNFAAGVTSQTITVSIANDSIFEQSEAFSVVLGGAVNATIASGTGTGTILDDGTGAGGTDSDRPSLSVSNVSATEGADTHAVFAVSLSNPSTTPVSVSLALAAGTATGGGVDFGAGLEVSTNGGATWTTAATATIAAGSTSVLVRTPITDDALNEAPEDFTLTATVTAGMTTNAAASGLATIVDNDARPALSIGDVTVNEAAGTATFTVTLNAASGQAVSVNYATSSGTATAGGDFTSASGTLDFAPGVTSQTLTVAIFNDTVFEQSESFTVLLGAAVNATIADNTGVGTIRDDGTGAGGTDNDTPSLSVSNVSVAEGTDTFAVFAVSLSNAATSPVSVSLSLANGTATGGGTDFGAGLEVSTNGGATWTASATATIAAGSTSVLVRTPIIDDALNEAPEDFTLTATRTAGISTNASAAGSATIDDNDPAPSLSINDVTVNEAAGTATFTVTLSTPSGQEVSVNYSTNSGTATAGIDFTASSGALDFAPGVTAQTITVPITNDSIFEGTETFTITLAGAVNATIADATGVGTIRDDGTGAGGTDNDTPSLSVASVTATEGSDTHAVFSVNLSNASTAPVTVALTLANGTATGSGVDFGAGLEVSTDGGATWASSATATIAAGSTGVLVRTPIIDDMLNESAETFTLNAVVTSGATINASAAGTGTIRDDDGPPAFSINDVTVNEAAGTATFTVRLASASGQTVTVDYATSNGTATAAADYVATAGTLTFAPGVTSQTITITILDDANFENNESFFVLLSNGVNAGIADDTGIGAIHDDGTGAGGTDDDRPTVSVSNASVTEGTDAHAVFAVSLSNVSTTAVDVSLALSNGTAIGGGTDFGPALEVSTDGGTTWLAANNVTIAGGRSSVLVRTPITDDALDEAGENFTLTATVTGGSTKNLSASGMAAIIDDDPTPALSINDVTVNEAAGTATFTVSLSGASGQTVSVNYATSDGTATAGADYTSASGTLSFAPGVMSQTVTISIANDTLFEQSEHFDVVLSTPVNATIADGLALGTIKDDGTGPGGTDDDKPTLSVSNVSVTEGIDSHAVFTVSLSNPSTTPVDLNLALVDGTAAGGGVDFGPGLEVSTDGGTSWTAANNATIAAGTTSLLVRAVITDDALNETAENFTLTATVATGTTTNAAATGTATITDNDTTPSLSIDNVTVNEAAGTATFTVTLSAASGRAVSVDYATSSGTATAGADFTSASGTLNFAAGVTSHTVTVAILNDTVFEQSEAFMVLLSAAVNATIADASGAGTILDDGTGAGGTDNDTPILSVSNVAVAEGADAFAVFAVSLSNTSTTPVSVSLALANGTAMGGGTDFGAGLEVSTDGGATWISAATATIAAGSTSVLVRTPINDDALNEASETFTLTGARSGGVTSNESAVGTGTIGDNDALPTISIDDVTVNEAAGTATFTVSLNTASGLPVSVDYATSNGTASAGADYLTVNGTLNFAAGVTSQTVTVTILDDAIFELSEGFTVALSSPFNATISDATGAGAILDNGTGAGGTDNDTPTLNVSNVAVTEGTDTHAVFAISLSNVSTTAVTVDLSLADGTAVGGGEDFGAGLEVSTDGGATWAPTASASFAPGATSMLVRTPITDDALNEAGEDFTLTATVTAGTTTNSTATGAATIGDNDTLPLLSIDDVTVNEAAGTATFTVTLSGPSGVSVSVDYAMNDVTASDGVDYTSASGTLNFAPGVTSRTITVAILNDALFEKSESFVVLLSGEVNATIADGMGVSAIFDDGTGAGGTDNDTPTLVVSDVSVTEGIHAYAVFEVTLSNPSTTPVSVSLALADGTAAGAGVDFAGALETSSDGGATWAAAAGATFTPGITSVLVRTAINNDALDENAEDFTLTATVSAGTTTNAAATGTATIIDDDAPPSVSIDNVTVNEAAGTATFTVSLSAPSGLAVSVNYATSDGTATAGADYAGTSGVLNFAAGVTSQTITVSILNDALYEQSESFDVVLSGAVNATIASGTGVGTIRDDGTGAGGTDNDTPSLSVSSVSVTEGTDTHAVFAVNLSNASTLPVSVSLALLDGSAKGGGVDFGAGLEVSTDGGATWVVAASATFAPGSTGVLVRTPIIDDLLDENAEDFTLTATVTGGTTTNPSATGAVTIADDDLPPSVSIADVVVNEGAGTMTFTVTLSAPSGRAVDVTYATSDGTAMDGADYTGKSGTLSFAPGVISQTITVAILNDAIFEQSETLEVVLTAPVNATISDDTSVGTILDDGTGAGGTDNDTPTLSVSSMTVTEGVDTHAVFTISLSVPAAIPVDVDLALIQQSAAGAGSDYGTSGVGNLEISMDGGVTWADATSASFAPWRTSFLARTPITSDQIAEADETFSLLATVTGGFTTNATAQGTALLHDPTMLPAPEVAAPPGGVKPAPSPFVFAYDSFHDFSRRGGNDPRTSPFAERLQPIDIWRPAMLPISPIYSGAANPGATLVIDLYNANGVKIGSMTVIADAGGNWLANFNSATLRDTPSDVRISQTDAPYSFGSGRGNNLRTYYAPAALNPGHFLSQSIADSLNDDPAPLLGDLDLANPIQLDAIKYGGEFLSSEGVASGD